MPWRLRRRLPILRRVMPEVEAAAADLEEGDAAEVEAAAADLEEGDTAEVEAAAADLEEGDAAKVEAAAADLEEGRSAEVAEVRRRLPISSWPTQRLPAHSMTTQ